MNYRVIKVLNNNTVISRDEDDREIVVTGNGIGYGKHYGMVIESSKIRNIYEPRNKAFIRRFEKMVAEIPEICFLEAEKIKGMAEESLNMNLNENLVLTLADHINFTIVQYKNKETRAVLMNTEFQTIYSKEYEISKRAVEMLSRDFAIEISEGEASAITFHIVNSEVGHSSNDAVIIANSVQDILNIVKRNLRCIKDNEEVDFSRLIVHLQFFLKRVINKQTDDASDFGQLLLNPNQGIYEGITDCLNEITEYMAMSFDYKMSETERFYLLIHITRILNTKRGE
ncbi:MAG: PRD domain-containing protein [Erysipelotrichaceae bacterium]|nr:PRD domain-containing protein [Erysipelotrichaceae bacterium]